MHIVIDIQTLVIVTVLFVLLIITIITISNKAMEVKLTFEQKVIPMCPEAPLNLAYGSVVFAKGRDCNRIIELHHGTTKMAFLLRFVLF